MFNLLQRENDMVNFKNILETKIANMHEDALFKAIYVDQLTGCMNRNAFSEVHSVESMAMVDLDSLKFINDYDGHREGDNHIKSLSRLLRRTFGQYNVFRMSGDEFVVVFSGNQEQLGAVLSTLRTKNPAFSFGTVGKCINMENGLIIADTNMLHQKVIRQEKGLRSGRGECPPWHYSFTK